MKNVNLGVRKLARVLKRKKSRSSSVTPDLTSQPLDTKQELVQKAIEDIRIFLYIVEESDTISSIAQKFNMSTVDLLFANQLYNNQPLYIGQALYVYNYNTNPPPSPSPTTTTEETEEKPCVSLFPTTEEAALELLSSYRVLLSSLRLNKDFSLCKESQPVATPTTLSRPPTALQLAMRLSHAGLLDEFREAVTYVQKNTKAAGILTGSPKHITFEADWDDPIMENGLINYQIDINTSDVMVCHLFEGAASGSPDPDEPEEPELQFGFLDEASAGSSMPATPASESYLQLTVVRAGVDPRVVRFKAESQRIHTLYKKIMAWTGRPINPLNLSSISSFLPPISASSTPFTTPPASTHTSARTSPILRPTAPSYSREVSSSNLDVFSQVPAKLLAQHQPEQGVLKESISFVTKNGKVGGVLTLTSSMVIFEPDLNDPAVVTHGLIANQVNFFMMDVYDCILPNDLGQSLADSKVSMQILVREGTSEKSIIFESEADKISQLSSRIRQQMAGRPKPVEFKASRPVSVPCSPTQVASPTSSNSPPSLNSMPSSPSSLLLSLRNSALGKFGVFEKISSRPSSGEVTPVESDSPECNSPALQAELIRNIESFVPKLFGESQLLNLDWMQFIFGGYASEYLRPSQRYYGTGESFLFKLSPKLEVYPWPNTNNFFIFTSERFISMGGGESGQYGLYLDADFSKGTSAFCDTFHNDELASSEFFECSLLEMWGFGETQ